jgi:hypothetical protein
VNLSITRILNLAALTAFAGTGLMQAAEQATFHLPVTAHWGQMVLEPGDYKMSLPALSLGKIAFQVIGSDKSFFELPQSTTVNDPSNSSHLKLVVFNGSYFVREFTSGPTGKMFTFAVPKTSHRQQVAKGGDNSLAVTVY